MASTNQTPHLGLSQWVLTDPFRMDDFNQDNAKIDAAVDGLDRKIDSGLNTAAQNLSAAVSKKAEFTLLRDITTSTGDIARIDVDISDLCFADWQYWAINLYMMQQTYVRVNGNGNCSYNGFGGMAAGSGYLMRLSSQGRLYLVPGQDARTLLNAIYFGYDGFYLGTSGSGYFSSTQSLNFYPATSGSKFTAGVRIKIWGVK